MTLMTTSIWSFTLLWKWYDFWTLYSRSLIIGTLITVNLAIPRLIKNFQVPWLLGFFTNNSSQYHDPGNQGLGIFFLLPGTFSGPSHPDNQGLAVTPFKTQFQYSENIHYPAAACLCCWIGTAYLFYKVHMAGTYYLYFCSMSSSISSVM